MNRLQFLHTPHLTSACVWCDQVFLVGDNAFALTLPTAPGREMVVHYHDCCFYALCHEHGVDADAEALHDAWESYEAFMSGGKVAVPKAAWQRYLTDRS
jgi:hypothetical protein